MEKAVFEVVATPFDEAAAQRGDLSAFSAEQYLCWVTQQASAIPDVVRAPGIEDISLRSADESMDALKSFPREVVAAVDWEETFLARFHSLREYVSRLSEMEKAERRVRVPPLRDFKAWSLFCFGEIYATDIEDHSESEDGSGEAEEERVDQQLKRRRAEVLATSEERVWDGALSVRPSVTLLLQFDQVMTQRLLLMHVSWLSERAVNPSRALWLFALLTHLETPLFRDTAAGIRSLYKRCSHLRTQGPTGDDLAALNALVCVAGKYFGQGEEYAALSSSATDGGEEAAEQDENKVSADSL